MLDLSYIEVNEDTCKYKKDGLTYTAIIKEVTPHHLSVKPISAVNFESGVYLTNMDTEFLGASFASDCYDHIELEIWMDGRGCDNSAIGVSGCYEPWRNCAA